MNDTRKLEQLTLITHAKYRVAQLAHAKLLREEAKLKEQLHSLSESLRNRAIASAEAPDTAKIAGADMNWQTWVEQRRRLLNLELGQCLVDQEASHNLTQLEFGREQAVRALKKQHDTKIKKDIGRREG